MRQRFSTRPFATSLAVLAYFYTLHNGRKIFRDAIFDKVGADAEHYASAGTYLFFGSSLAILWRWRRNRHHGFT